MTSDRSMCDKLWQHRLKKLVSAWSVTSRKKAKAKAKAKRSSHFLTDRTTDWG